MSEASEEEILPDIVPSKLYQLSLARGFGWKWFLTILCQKWVMQCTLMSEEMVQNIISKQGAIISTPLHLPPDRPSPCLCNFHRKY